MTTLAERKLAIENRNRLYDYTLSSGRKKARKEKVSLVTREEKLMVFIDEYRDFFLKDVKNYVIKTKSKNENKQMMEIVKYAFNKFPVPVFMNEAWKIKDNELNLLSRDCEIPKQKKTEYKDWYICMAQGGSLYKKYFKNFLTKKETHIFSVCKYELTINEVIVYAIAKAESENDGISLRIAHSKISRLNLKNDFYKNIIRFFAKNTPKSVNEINDLIDYFASQKQANPNYTVLGQGYTIESLKHKMESWHRDLRRLKDIGNDVWEGFLLEDKSYKDKNGQNEEIYWTLTQIKSAKALQAEGNAQRHCVFSYKSLCVNGRISIWSLSLIDKFGISSRKLTIELNNNDEIVQARGFANRSARKNEQAILQKWAREERLKLDLRY